ncbi:hypothetical protein [Methanoculleus sp.]|uniref:hypothetical protein n=1 Tax=Methanoculleus sp. TaxID=90427 RepID=UPI0025E44356|nr:hypothetical protein [Methanoculleus sp.]
MAFTYSIYTDKSFYIQESVLNDFISEQKIKNDTSLLVIENKLVALKYDIEKVEDVNNKRIEVLGWSFVIMSSFITIILGLNIYNYRTTIREIVKDEIDNKEDKIIKHYKKLNEDLEKLYKQYTEELKKLRNK